MPRQIANAHTIFNVINTLLFIGFTGHLAKLVIHLIPKKIEVEKVIVKPKYLDDALIETPALALERVRMEISHMGEILLTMFAGLREGSLQRDRKKLEEISQMDDKIDILEDEIFRYLGAIRKRTLSEKESEDVALLMKVSDTFESVGDVIETDLVGISCRALDENVQPSDAIRYLFRELGDRVTLALEQTIVAVKENDEVVANKVLALKADIDHLISQALDIQSTALAGIDQEHIRNIRMEMTILENMKRIYTHLKRISREIVPRAAQVP